MLNAEELKQKPRQRIKLMQSYYRRLETQWKESILSFLKYSKDKQTCSQVSLKSTKGIFSLRWNSPEETKKKIQACLLKLTAIQRNRRCTQVLKWQPKRTTSLSWKTNFHVLVLTYSRQSCASVIYKLRIPA